MAVLWSQQNEETHYRVTRAGNSLRLYRNRVLHSQWNPRDPIKGHIWELFLLSSFVCKEDIKRVLVLGAGGGAVINLVHHFFINAFVDAVDLDKQHLYVAKNYFKVDLKKCCLIGADAKVWINEHKIDKYDLIIEDLFAEKDGIPYRAVEADHVWIKKLLALLNKQGSLIMNFADQSEWKLSRDQLMAKNIHLTYSASISQNKNCDNRIVYFSKRNLSAGTVKKSLQNIISNRFLKYWQAGQFTYRSLW